MKIINYKKSFTLAEVLITLGIIGIVAAMTLPSLIGNYKKKVLKEQFKVAYSLLQQTWNKVVADLEYTPECFYWSKGKYATICVEYDEFGRCIKKTLPDGSPLPADMYGRFNECSIFREQIEKNLQVIQLCKGNAYQKGCLPDYEGYDTILQNNSEDDMSDDEAFSKSRGCSNLRKDYLKVNSYVYVLKNGIILIPYSPNNFATFLVDINGKKGPNKWGYDVFIFTTSVVDIGYPLVLDGFQCSLAEEGGLLTKEMIEQMNSK